MFYSFYTIKPDNVFLTIIIKLLSVRLFKKKREIGGFYYKVM